MIFLCHSYLLTLFPWTSKGSLPQCTVFLDLCQGPSRTPAWVPSTRYSPSGTACLCVVFYSQAATLSRSLLQSGLPMGCSVLQGISTFCSCGCHKTAPPRLQCGLICSRTVPRRLQKDNLHHHGLLHSLKEEKTNKRKNQNPKLYCS